MEKLSKALTWDDLANLYDKKHKNGLPARCKPMQEIFRWAKNQTEKFKVTEEGTIHKILIK